MAPCSAAWAVPEAVGPASLPAAAASPKNSCSAAGAGRWRQPGPTSPSTQQFPSPPPPARRTRWGRNPHRSGSPRWPKWPHGPRFAQLRLRTFFYRSLAPPSSGCRTLVSTQYLDSYTKEATQFWEITNAPICGWNASGPPGGGPDQVHGTSAGTANGWDNARFPYARRCPGWIPPGCPNKVRRLAALHLQSPVKHVNQVRTTSFLW